jgi:hypothetical protein
VQHRVDPSGVCASRQVAKPETGSDVERMIFAGAFVLLCEAIGCGIHAIIGLMVQRIVRGRVDRLLGYQRVLDARRVEASADRLRELASDEIRPVRLWTARNRLAPPDALDRLARDEDSSVRWNALLNPHLPDAALRWLAEHEMREAGTRWFIYRERIVHHPNTSDALRAELLAVGACSCPRPCGRSAYAAPWIPRTERATSGPA